MRINARLTTALRRLRFAAGRAPRDLPETAAYLRYQVSRNAPATSPLQMPWGEFQCPHIGVARSQFEEIFVKRQYSFRPVAPAPVIIDCGGNAGFSAIWFKQNYADCRLTVYEADLELAGLLAGNLSRAGYRDVDVRPEAVWIENGELAFAATGLDTGKLHREGGRRVKAIDLATALPDHVDLLKMDIEGAEFEVIPRLMSSGAMDKIRHLAVEFHPTRATFRRMLEIFQTLEATGWKLSFESFLGPFCGLEPAESPFEAVGQNRMFVQTYLWRE